jgi:type IV pilus assembly protein PilO
VANFSEFLEEAKNFELSELDFNRIGVWPLPAKIAVYVAAAILIVAAGYFFLIKDKNLELANAERQEQSLRSSFERKADEAANLAGYREQMVKMEESFDAILKQLPSDTEVPGLLEDIDEKGVSSSLSIERIELQPEQSSEFYIELPIKIEVTGGYHEFGAFVSGIAGMPRIVTLHDFTIKRLDKQAALRMDILAKTYRYKAQDEK